MFYRFRNIQLFLAIAIGIGLLIFQSFSFTAETASLPDSIIYGYLEDLNQKVILLDKAGQDFERDKIEVAVLQEKVLETRLSYKKAEFYIAFHYAEYANEHLNGAPLLHIEKSETRAQVIEPEGLQVLDEMAFSPEAIENKNEIASLCKKLMTNYGVLYENIQEIPLANLDMAMRQQLVRIYTLGLTGFDTPGSLNAIPEAAASLEAMHYFFRNNFKNINSKRKAEIEMLFEESVAVLKNASFESLDRLDFLKRYVDPLYNYLSAFQLEKKPEFMDASSSWNAKSKSLFAEDFLNPYFFTELKEEEDNADLRALGKLLFFDPILSNTENMSCATCHQPNKGFADGTIKSLSSIQGKTVLRNAPTLINAVYADRYFYDLRAFTLEQQAEHVIFNSDEFDTAYSAILKKLDASNDYQEKFKKAFGRNGITREKFSKALASYVLSLRSFNSAFDKYARGETKEIDLKIKNGFNLFMGKASCATCHFAPVFSGLVPPFYSESESEILGVLSNPRSKSFALDADEGRWGNKIASELAWIYEKSFKTTTVRNADLTAPYFHNGAYETLEDVIDFYNEGGGEGMGLAVQNQTLSPDPLDLTEKEKKELIAFIKSLNDIPTGK